LRELFGGQLHAGLLWCGCRIDLVLRRWYGRAVADYCAAAW
jgi:hypothetical protein